MAWLKTRDVRTNCIIARHITANIIAYDKLTITEGNILIGDSSNNGELLDVGAAAGALAIGDGAGDITVRQLSGAISLSATGVTALTGFLPTAGSKQTISSGTLTLGGVPVALVEGEAGAADNLDTMAGMADGEIAFLYCYDAAANITIRDNAVGGGNIYTPRAASIVLDVVQDGVVIQRQGTDYMVLAKMLQAGWGTTTQAPGTSDSGTASITMGGSTASGTASISMGGNTASSTATVTENNPDPSMSMWMNPGAAGGVNLVPQKAVDFDESTWGNITQMNESPRNVQADFSGTWDGGNIEITGLDSTGADTTETITASAGSVVQGTKGWHKVRRIRNLGTRTAGTVDVQDGDKIGVHVGSLTPGNLEAYELSAGGRDAGASIASSGLITFSTALNGARDYYVTFTLANAYTDAGHTHGATGLTATDSGHTHGATGLTATDAGHTHTHSATHIHTV